MKILFVEDNQQDQELCFNAVDDFNEDNNCNVVIDCCSNVETALIKLSESYYDGAIIDMKLANEGNEGNEVIDEIKRTFRRIPVAIMTGTPDVISPEDFPLVEIYKKGESEYRSIISELYMIYKTGLTKIMGGKGEIEKKLGEIFINNILPQRSSWMGYAKKDSVKTEKALLRYTLNHLVQLLDNDVETCYPEEMYIYPLISPSISIGCILQKKNNNCYYVIMNPACDLAVRPNGNCNTDRALLVEIQSIKDVFTDFNWSDLSASNKKELNKLYKNNKTGYYHWLPKVDFFPGGTINFRRVSTYSECELDTDFHKSNLQISPSFIKDIVSRFSSYYARQGQPDIEYDITTH
ncbi:MAG TPA: response regulator [Morganella sp. (in: Bacteria)]|nr:response regulator [Morganella sp. (in: enterobacteria)]